jgi:hypothetical protein
MGNVGSPKLNQFDMRQRMAYAPLMASTLKLLPLNTFAASIA